MGYDDKKIVRYYNRVWKVRVLGWRSGPRGGTYVVEPAEDYPGWPFGEKRVVRAEYMGNLGDLGEKKRGEWLMGVPYPERAYFAGEIKMGVALRSWLRREAEQMTSPKRRVRLVVPNAGSGPIGRLFRLYDGMDTTGMMSTVYYPYALHRADWPMRGAWVEVDRAYLGTVVALQQIGMLDWFNRLSEASKRLVQRDLEIVLRVGRTREALVELGMAEDAAMCGVVVLGDGDDVEGSVVVQAALELGVPLTVVGAQDIMDWWSGGGGVGEADVVSEAVV